MLSISYSYRSRHLCRRGRINTSLITFQGLVYLWPSLFYYFCWLTTHRPLSLESLSLVCVHHQYNYICTYLYIISIYNIGMYDCTHSGSRASHLSWGSKMSCFKVSYAFPCSRKSKFQSNYFESIFYCFLLLTLFFYG